MILDIITAALIIIPMGIGMWRGFLYVLVRLLGWIGSLAAGFFAAPYARDFLGQTVVGDRIHDLLSDQFSGAADGVTDQTEVLPSILSDSIDQTVHNTAEMMTQAVEGAILTVLGFLLVAVLIRLILIFVIRPLTKKKKKILLPNKVGGLILGAAEGLLLAFVFLAALIPVMNLSSPDTASAIAESLRFSYLAGNLYDGNLLLAIF